MLVSISKILLPTKSCKIIEAITIGPIPSEMIEPKSVPNIIAKYSNLSSALFDNPKRATFAKMKKAPPASAEGALYYISGRGGRIRTYDLLLPRQAR